MKELFRHIILITALAMLCGMVRASAPRDSVMQDSLVGDKLYYLELRGTIRHLIGENKDEAQALDSAVIKVFNEKNVLVAQFLTNRKGRCNFRLPLNRKFVVEISKQGFFAKKIEVNTKVPLEKKFAYIFTFSVDIFDEISGLDVAALKKPIARIEYLFPISQFDYDNVYTSKINTDLKKMYKEYYRLQKEAADSSTVTGDRKPMTVEKKTVPANKKTVPEKKQGPADTSKKKAN
jgi:hypothetical protein